MDGSKAITVEKDSDLVDAHELGKQVASELASKGIAELAKNWREKVEEWNRR